MMSLQSEAEGSPKPVMKEHAVQLRLKLWNNLVAVIRANNSTCIAHTRRDVRHFKMQCAFGTISLEFTMW